VNWGVDAGPVVWGVWRTTVFITGSVVVVGFGGRVVVTRGAAVVGVRGRVVVLLRVNEVLPGALAVACVVTGTVVGPEEELPRVRVVVGTLP
jgi:hypothetical protein